MQIDFVHDVLLSLFIGLFLSVVRVHVLVEFLDSLVLIYLVFLSRKVGVALHVVVKVYESPVLEVDPARHEVFVVTHLI